MLGRELQLLGGQQQIGEHGEAHQQGRDVGQQHRAAGRGAKVHQRLADLQLVRETRSTSAATATTNRTMTGSLPHPQVPPLEIASSSAVSATDSSAAPT